MTNGGGRKEHGRVARITVLLLAILLLPAVIMVLTLPFWVQKVVESELRRLGFREPQVQVRSIGFSRAVLGPLLLRGTEHDLFIRRLELEYSISDLRRGAVAAIRVDGGAVWLHLDGEGFRIAGVPPDLLQPTAAAASVQRRQELFLEEVQLFIKTGVGDIELTLDGTAQLRQVAGEQAYTGSLQIAQINHAATGTVGPVDLNFEFSADTLTLQMETAAGAARHLGLGAGDFSAEIALSAGDITFAGAVELLPTTWLKAQRAVSPLKLQLQGSVVIAAGMMQSYNCRVFIPKQRIWISWEDVEVACEGVLEAELDFLGSPASLQLSCDLEITDAEFTAATVKGKISRASLHAVGPALDLSVLEPKDFVQQFKAQLALDGAVRVEGLQVDGIPEITIGAIAASMPFAWRYSDGLVVAPEAAEGELAVTALQWRSLELQNLQGRILHTGKGVEIAAAGLLPAWQTEVQLQQNLDWSEELNFNVTAQVENAVLAPEDSWYKKLTGQQNLQLTGAVSAALYLSSSRGRWQSRADIEILDVDLELAEREISVTGITGKLTLLDLSALRSMPHQELRFVKATIPGTEFLDGSIQYRLDSPESIFVEKAEVGWCEGRLMVYAAAVGMPHPEVDFIIYANRLSVACIVTLLQGVQGTGSGTLYGRLPLAWKNDRISYGDGFLYTAPGEQGVLQLSDIGILKEQLEQTLGRGEQVDRIQNALGDFRFSVFRLDLYETEAGAESLLRLQLVGESPKEKGVGPIHLTVNIRGALADLINMSLQLGGAQEGR